MAMQLLDYFIFGLMLLISAGIGLYVRFSGNKQKSSEEFLMGNREMGILPVSFSLTASFMSAVTVLGVSNENYQFGTQFVVINISYILATPIAAYLFLPVFFKLQATSAYEYLERRFGKSARTAASLAFSIQILLYMAIVLYAPALALEAVTGLDKNWAIIIVGITVLFYTHIGGIKAVLLTDVFQSILMFVAIFLVVISGIIHAGGIGEIFRVANEGQRLELWNFNPDPTVRHTWFSLVIGGAFTYLSLYAVNQTQVQRLLTIKKLKSAQKALWWNLPILSTLSLTTSFSGLVIYYYYRKCDPLKSGRISSRDQNMPIYVSDALSHLPGVCGLFVAGIFSASLSSLSSCLNSLAAVTLEDYFKPLYKYFKGRPLEISSDRSAMPSKIITACYGLACLGLAFLVDRIGGILQASLVVFGVVGGPLLALFTLGMFIVTANERGSIIGLFSGIIISMWIGFGPKPPPQLLEFSVEDCSQFGLFNVTSPINHSFIPTHQNSGAFYLYRLSYLYAVVIGFSITLIIGWFTSAILKYFNLQGHERIYLSGAKRVINCDLFVPPLAKRLMKRNEMREKILLQNPNSATHVSGLELILNEEQSEYRKV